MGNLNMNQTGIMRYSVVVILWISMSMSSIAFGENSEYDEGGAPENADLFPIVYSGAAITMGAHSTIFGNTQAVSAVTLGEAAELNGSLSAGAAVTLDKDGTVVGDVTAGEAATIGATALIIGDLSAASKIFVGAGAEVSGNLRTGAAAKLGAAAKVGGNAIAFNSVTLGANAQIGKNESVGNVRAVNGSIVLGETALVQGNAKAGTIISLGLNAEILGYEAQHANPNDFTNDAAGPLATRIEELTQRQKELAETFVPTYNELTTTIDKNRDFYAGTYHASALTTTAGITLTFIGSGYGERDEWLINVDTYLSFGANVSIELVDVAPGSTIIFNAGSYTTVGANSILKGTIFAGTYITTGENTVITGIGSDCGGMYATNGAITLGASSTFGSLGCGYTEQQSEEDVKYGEYDEYSEYGEYGEYGEYDEYEEYKEYKEYNGI
jgi:carbonic anhydrase/acetyltransferase-like protein (isoleucine patch superfamily)